MFKTVVWNSHYSHHSWSCCDGTFITYDLQILQRRRLWTWRVPCPGRTDGRRPVAVKWMAEYCDSNRSTVKLPGLCDPLHDHRRLTLRHRSTCLDLLYNRLYDKSATNRKSNTGNPQQLCRLRQKTTSHRRLTTSPQHPNMLCSSSYDLLSNKSTTNRTIVEFVPLRHRSIDGRLLAFDVIVKRSPVWSGRGHLVRRTSQYYADARPTSVQTEMLWRDSNYRHTARNTARNIAVFGNITDFCRLIFPPLKH